MAETRLLKKDLFGEIRLRQTGDGPVIERDCAPARSWLRWLARRLLRREAEVLTALDGVAGVPEVQRIETDLLVRGYLPGVPMHHARPADPDYFRSASRLLRRLHRAGVVHNDLAKEANILVAENGNPAFIDFQLAWHTPRRSALFRLLAREDRRHLLKHKRTYCSDRLTKRELGLLANPSLPSKIWMKTGKPVYLFITRRLLGWADREGAADRGDQA
ncbi:MAG: serine/threonine protein kinase [Gammaproteobacteria bacterium]|nr:serine/threonine protein kinase [Gammaproteobacteria bacterium]